MKHLKLTALLLALVLLLGLAACGKTETDPAAETTDPAAETADPAADGATLPDAAPVTAGESGNAYCDAIGVAPEATLLTVNGEAITAEEYFYWLQSSYDYLVQNYGEVTDWTATVGDQTISEYLLADTLEAAKFYHVFTTTAMSQYPELALTADEQQEIDDYLAEYIATYFTDEAAFDEALTASLSIGRDVFVYANCTVPALYNKLFTLMYDGSDYAAAAGADELQAYLDEQVTPQGYIHAAHILIKTVDDDYEPLPDEEIAEAKAWAEELLATLQADNSNFLALMQQYSQDPGKESYPTGYYFNADSGFVQSFYDAAAALGENEMSGLVESEYGYHIILRLPIDPADFAEEVCWSQYEDIVDGWAAGCTVEYGEGYDRIDPAALLGGTTTPAS